VICNVRLRRRRKVQHGRRRPRRREWRTLQLPTRLLALIQMNQCTVSVSRYTESVILICCCVLMIEL